ncbi:transporter [Henriciella aquimarina]|uniref:transporter n=1 Tax=Henriciella aquimarina TaxID=545261 RepID=UPI000A0732AB|nr:transporter [Henriciella aquimarina]
MKHQTLLAGLVLACATAQPALAHEDDATAPHAKDHAPIGVMGDHRHGKGGWMLSYRYMRMEMEGNRDGTDTLSPDEIATAVPNRFAGQPMMPPTLRVVPEDMTMNMHMAGVMYGLTDRVTLMGMVNWLSSEMTHITYQGGMGTDRLGRFTAESEGFGDSSVTAIIGLDDGSDPDRQINLNIGVSIPTGSIDETSEVLSPMNMRPTLRMPYAMQLGSGTWDIKPALTLRQHAGQWSFGAQGGATIRLDENDEGYSLGDRYEATAWAAFEPQPWISVSGRLKAVTQGKIDGIDPAIMAPVQSADPDNYGGDTLEALAGVNLVGQSGALHGQRLAFELGLPLYRDLNGPQLETDLTLTVGWQKAW